MFYWHGFDCMLGHLARRPTALQGLPRLGDAAALAALLRRGAAAGAEVPAGALRHAARHGGGVRGEAAGASAPPLNHPPITVQYFIEKKIGGAFPGACLRAFLAFPKAFPAFPRLFSYFFYDKLFFYTI